MSLVEEQLSKARKAVYKVCLFAHWIWEEQTLPFVMVHELAGDRAVIFVSALVAILSSSYSVSKYNIVTEECFSSDNLFFCAPEAVTSETSSLLRLWPYQWMKHKC